MSRSYISRKQVICAFLDFVFPTLVILSGYLAFSKLFVLTQAGTTIFFYKNISPIFVFLRVVRDFFMQVSFKVIVFLLVASRKGFENLHTHPQEFRNRGLNHAITSVLPIVMLQITSVNLPLFRYLRN